MMHRAFAVGLCAGLLPLSLLAQDSTTISLKYGAFDPGAAPAVVSPALRGDADTNLWIVQFETRPTEELRQAVRSFGGEISSYLPDNAYVVRMPIGAAAGVREKTGIRSVSYYHPAFRLEEQLRFELANNAVPERRYNIVVVDKRRDKPSLERKIGGIGGTVESDGGGSLLFEATLNQTQLLQAARFDEVLWIDRWGAPEDDMDNARQQGGGDYVESITGYTGQGITGHQMEGLNPSHVDWTNTPIGFPAGCTSSSGHGHNTAGIVYGNGSSSPLARGMAPDAQAIYTSCRNNRYNNFQSLISTHEIMFTTASWGSPRTFDYTSVSAEADDICFDQDIIWTNSQSNAGNQDSRAEAWAKNVFAIGGVRHNNNANPLDDSWQAGSASIGPAADGRTKPDLCAYYDNIATSASNGSFTATFGGTSGATPIVAGHNAIALQMYTDGVFGNTLRVPGGTRFQNKPHFPTLKAMQIVCAEPYAFTATSNDNRREHQGYGFPNLRNMWDDRNLMVLVDEDDVIAQGEGVAYTVAVPAGRPLLKVSMSYSDVAGNPSSTIATVNDLTLRVTSPSGVSYWGNAGLEDGNWSTTTGSRDRKNTAENVFVQSPMAGNWIVEVMGYSIPVDTHVETPAVDADFGLAVRGATLVSSSRITVAAGSVTAFGQACPGSVPAPTYCANVNPGGGSLTRATRQWEYAYEATATSAVSVAGFELWTASASGSSVTVAAAIYASTSGLPSVTPLATTTMTVGGAEGYYGATFASPVAIAAGSTYYVAINQGNVVFVSTLTSGASSPGYYRNNSGWNRSGLATEPSFRVICAGQSSSTLAPRFDVTGFAEVGQPIEMTLEDAVANAPVGLMIGSSNTMLGSTPLPLDLGFIGATGCQLLVNSQAMLSLTTNANGEFTRPLVIPSDSTLVGQTFYMQCAIVDAAANSLGIVTTAGRAIAIGGN